MRDNTGLPQAGYRVRMDVSDIKNSATDQFGTLEINQPCKEEKKKSIQKKLLNLGKTESYVGF